MAPAPEAPGRGPGPGGGGAAESAAAPAAGTGARLTAGLLLAAAGLAGTACAGPERSEAPVREEVYVEVMARLAAVRAAADSSRAALPSPGQDADSAGRDAPPLQAGPDPEGRSRTLAQGTADSLREAVLREHEVRREDLKAFARIVGDEPKRMKTLWTRIAARADSLREAGWPPTAAPVEPDSSRGGGP